MKPKTVFCVYMATLLWMAFVFGMLLLAGFHILEVQNITLMGLIASEVFALMASGSAYYFLIRKPKEKRDEDTDGA